MTMNKKSQVDYTVNQQRAFEIVERKGLGHPDTLSDTLGERLSISYSKYTLSNFGAILHHNFDKVGMMGGMSRVQFGKGELKEPIRILINGRASERFGGTSIPVRDILEHETRKLFFEMFPMLNTDKDIRIIYEVSTGSSPGGLEEFKSMRHRWFSPLSLADLGELQFLACNDTSLGCAFFKKSTIEQLVYDVEKSLNSSSYRTRNPWIGSDIKIMSYTSQDEDIYITLAIPQMCSHVESIDNYFFNLETVKDTVLHLFEHFNSPKDLHISINTRDKRASHNTDLYLTFTGSSIEMGDEGFVGRGNRIGGLITPFRPYTMEGICGKNPVYHTGKMYSVAAYSISQMIFDKLGIESHISLIGQSGQDLSTPWKILVSLKSGCNDNETNQIEDIIYRTLSDFGTITSGILNSEYPMC